LFYMLRQIGKERASGAQVKTLGFLLPLMAVPYRAAPREVVAPQRAPARQAAALTLPPIDPNLPCMSAIAFDTHKFIRTLKESGIPENQAEAIAEAFRSAHIEAELATKADLRELEYRLIIKLGAMMMAAIATVAALVKLL